MTTNSPNTKVLQLDKRCYKLLDIGEGWWGAKNFLDERTEDILTFSMRSFFCGLNFRVALLLIGCTRDHIWWDILNPALVSYPRKQTLIPVYSN